MSTTSYAHCRLLPGGAANVLATLIRQHGYDTHTRIFTLFSRNRSRDVDGHAIPVTCAMPRRLQSVFFFFQDHRVPVFSWLFDYRNLIFFYPQLLALLRKKIARHHTDHLVISSFAVAKNTVPATGDRHPTTTLYLHSPMQYIHTHRDEYHAKITGIKGWIFDLIVHKLRRRDTLPRSYDTIIANSQYTADCAKKIYGLTIDRIQYPPVDVSFGQQAPILSPDNYFVYVGRLVRFVKEVDLLVKLMNQTGQHLVLIGSGPDEAYLKNIAGPTCLFVGWIDDVQERIDIIRKSRGLLNITKESFGIATVEALLCGVPVFGYNDGATPELVGQQSGILVDNKQQHTLLSGFEDFAHRTRNRKHIQHTIQELLD